MQVEGRTLTEQTLVTEVEHLAYLRYGDQVSQDGFFNAVPTGRLRRVRDGGGNPVDLVTGLIRGVNEHRILMHAFVPDEQEVIAGTTIAGEIDERGRPTHRRWGSTSTTAPARRCRSSSTTRSQVTSVSCENGRQTLAGRLRVTSDTPPNVAELPADGRRLQRRLR